MTTPKPKLFSTNPAPPPAPPTMTDLTRGLERVEQQHAMALRSRNELRASLQLALVTPEPIALDQARELRNQIEDTDDRLELLAEQRTAFVRALEQARERERAATWVKARADAEAAAARMRGAAAAIQQWAKSGAGLIDAFANEQIKFFDAMRPTGISAADKSLLPQLGQIIALNLFAHSGGRLPPPRSTLLNAFELAQPGSPADIVRRAEDLIVSSLRGFDEPQPPQAA